MTKGADLVVEEAAAPFLPRGVFLALPPPAPAPAPAPRLRLDGVEAESEAPAAAAETPSLRRSFCKCCLEGEMNG